jgi:hypothetical protein
MKDDANQQAEAEADKIKKDRDIAKNALIELLFQER